MYGHEICNFRGKHERKVWYDEKIKKYLLDPKTLYEWASYSLSYRVLKIEQMFNVKIHYTTLSTFYRKHKVTCRKPQYTYLRKLKKKDELIKDQKSVAFEMAELIMKGKQIVYVDDSTFHRWLLPTRTWVTRDMVL